MNWSRIVAARRRHRRRQQAINLVLLVGLLLAGLLWAGQLWSAASARSPAPPYALAQEGPLGGLAPGQTTSSAVVTLTFRATGGATTVVPEVEVAPVGHPGMRTVDVTGPALPVGARARMVRLPIGPLPGGIAYRWQARLVDAEGHTSTWIAFAPQGGIAFLVARPGPPAPVLASPTHPDPRAWYTTTLATITWPRPRTSARIAGYAYRLDRRLAGLGLSARWLMVRQPYLQVRLPTDGRWYVHVRARDGAGLWSNVATYPLQVDRQPVAFRTGTVPFAHVAFDPDVEGEPMAFTLIGVARMRLDVHAQDTGIVVRTIDGGLQSGNGTVTWDGRDGTGRLLPDGPYRLVLTATDPFGRQAVADYSDITVLRRRVVVSLHQQRLVAYEGTRVMTSTLVTTGNRRLPTPVGIFHVLAIYHPFHMVSPWPPSSPNYYAPVQLQYALLFDQSGLFIHDAPWRRRFGPGSNAAVGRPGQDLTGTHGCVNVPGWMAAWLAGWAPVGTAVVVVP